MTNENLINLINKDKPVELVQELEDYEIKTSKLSPAARAKVIKRYGGNYVSEDKEGYGPCEICKKPEQEKYLFLACPGVKNGNPCGNPEKTYWVHSTDGWRTMITNRARIKCSGCSTKSHMSYWSFSCSDHKGKYYDTDKATFRKSLAAVIGAEEYLGTSMVDDVITYMSAPEHINEARSGWQS